MTWLKNNWPALILGALFTFLSLGLQSTQRGSPSLAQIPNGGWVVVFTDEGECNQAARIVSEQWAASAPYQATCVRAVGAAP